MSSTGRKSAPQGMNTVPLHRHNAYLFIRAVRFVQLLRPSVVTFNLLSCLFYSLYCTKYIKIFEQFFNSYLEFSIII